MPSNPPYPIAAQPKREIFDPWNSSSTGHQRAENRLSGSTSWRSSRTTKLAAQFAAGATGGDRVRDTVGAGSEGFVKGERTANGGWKRGTIEELPASPQAPLPPPLPLPADPPSPSSPSAFLPPSSGAGPAPPSSSLEAELPAQTPSAPPQIFAHLTIYVNGSTYPLISDHKLKHLLVTHGAGLSLTPGRRSVTHVVLGKTNAAGKGGAGGGLAAGKIQKEIARTRSGGNAVRFVTVEWVLECVKQGKRVSEARFEVVKTRPAGVRGFVLPSDAGKRGKDEEKDAV
ncbi:hypothetical protein K461DRAFT_228306 [Myriangium duriaei CBS 260.36]|uniref:BRCT domain-containing protein n=1 Tax=Myriangium duriaei CBS 260.36 TaxID=1168546 RepID=A0A9P4J0P6_9PEZI|nr:hypothetical protein K461DRAFT_228306 [Myriangium duriaei CBS 260.36]